MGCAKCIFKGFHVFFNCEKEVICNWSVDSIAFQKLSLFLWSTECLLYSLGRWVNVSVPSSSRHTSTSFRTVKYKTGLNNVTFSYKKYLHTKFFGLRLLIHFIFLETRILQNWLGFFLQSNVSLLTNGLPNWKWLWQGLE